AAGPGEAQPPPPPAAPEQTGGMAPRYGALAPYDDGFAGAGYGRIPSGPGGTADTGPGTGTQPGQPASTPQLAAPRQGPQPHDDVHAPATPPASAPQTDAQPAQGPQPHDDAHARPVGGQRPQDGGGGLAAPGSPRLTMRGGGAGPGRFGL